MLQQLTYGPNYGAVEHSITKDNQELFTFLQLTKKKKELVVNSRCAHTDFPLLLTDLNTQKHLFLIINNQQVLSKKIDVTSNNQVELVQNAFPNVVLNDFYYETYSSDSDSFVAICRKDYVDSLIGKYEAKKIDVIDFSLGNLVFQNVLPFIESDAVYTSNAQIRIENNSITTIERKVADQNYTINDLEVSNTEILPLAGVLAYYFGRDNEQLGLLDKISLLKKEFKQKRFFDIGLKSALGLLFSILLINFLIFSSYTTKINNLTSEIQLNEQTKKSLLILEEKVAQKERVLTSLQSASHTKASRFIDEIGELVPNSIQLTALNYQPILGRVKKEKPLNIIENRIVLKGISKKSNDFTKFTSALEVKNWTDKVNIISYGKEKRVTEFEIVIDVKNE